MTEGTLAGTMGKVAGSLNSGPVVYEDRASRIGPAFCFFGLGIVEKVARYANSWELLICDPSMADYVIQLSPKLFEGANPPVNPQDLIGEQVITGWRGDYRWVDWDQATDRNDLQVLHILTGPSGGTTLVKK